MAALNRHTAKGLFLGALAALVVVLGITPVLAQTPALTGGSAAPRQPVNPFSEPGSILGLSNGASPQMIPGAAFTSDGNSGDFFFNFAGGYLQGSTGVPCQKAPVDLPANAVITAIWGSLYDNEASSDFWVMLHRVNNYTGSEDVMAMISSSGADTVIQTPYNVSITASTVLYPTYSYYVTTCLSSSNHRIYSVRIYYDYQIYLPVIGK